jgi:putative FmdB family regulatory protein
MPTFEFKCQKCGHRFDTVLSFADRNNPQACTQCQGAAEKQVTQIDFVLKGDGWAGKSLKIREQMSRKNVRLADKEKERPAGMTLAPNVEGERVDSWVEAKKLAASKGKNTDSYDPLVRQERGGA